jgi:hypothetical protein
MAPHAELTQAFRLPAVAAFGRGFDSPLPIGFHMRATFIYPADELTIYLQRKTLQVNSRSEGNHKCFDKSLFASLSLSVFYGSVVIVKVRDAKARGKPVSHPFRKKTLPVSRM